jgi:hypothetical protein
MLIKETFVLTAMKGFMEQGGPRPRQWEEMTRRRATFFTHPPRVCTRYST